MFNRLTMSFDEFEAEGIMFLCKETSRPPKYVLKWLLKEKLKEVGFAEIFEESQKKKNLEYETTIEAEINSALAKHNLLIEQAAEKWPDMTSQPRVIVIQRAADSVVLKTRDGHIEPETVVFEEVNGQWMGYSPLHETLLISPKAQSENTS